MLILNKLKASMKKRVIAAEFLLAPGHDFTPK